MQSQNIFPPLFGQRDIPELKAAPPRALRSAGRGRELVFSGSCEPVRTPFPRGCRCRKARTRTRGKPALRAPPSRLSGDTEPCTARPQRACGFRGCRETVCDEASSARGRPPETRRLPQPLGPLTTLSRTCRTPAGHEPLFAPRVWHKCSLDTRARQPPEPAVSGTAAPHSPPGSDGGARGASGEEGWPGGS